MYHSGDAQRVLDPRPSVVRQPNLGRFVLGHWSAGYQRDDVRLGWHRNWTRLRSVGACLAQGTQNRSMAGSDTSVEHRQFLFAAIGASHHR